MIPMSKIAVIGDEDLIEGLKIFGFDTFFVKEENKITNLFKEILEKGYFFCLIQEIYFLRLKDLIKEINEKPFPLVLPLPDHREIKGVGKELLQQISLKAVGAEIL